VKLVSREGSDGGRLVDGCWAKRKERCCVTLATRGKKMKKIGGSKVRGKKILYTKRGKEKNNAEVSTGEEEKVENFTARWVGGSIF